MVLCLGRSSNRSAWYFPGLHLPNWGGSRRRKHTLSQQRCWPNQNHRPSWTYYLLSVEFLLWISLGRWPTLWFGMQQQQKASLQFLAQSWSEVFQLRMRWLRGRNRWPGSQSQRGMWQLLLSPIHSPWEIHSSSWGPARPVCSSPTAMLGARRAPTQIPASPCLPARWYPWWWPGPTAGAGASGTASKRGCTPPSRRAVGAPVSPSCSGREEWVPQGHS